MTSQISDTLEVHGREVMADEFIPLGEHPAIEDVTYKHACENLLSVGTTACWRSYRAHWRLTDTHLELKKIDGGFRLRSQRPIEASWLSGRLVLPLEDVHTFSQGWLQAPYVERICITLEKGLIVGTEQLDWMQTITLWEPFNVGFVRRRVIWGTGRASANAA